MRAGVAAVWIKLQSAGIPVVAVLNNVDRTPQPIYQCVAEHTDSLSDCAFAPIYETADTQKDLAAEFDVGVIDMNELICPMGECPTVIGSVLVYRDAAHLTKTYVESLAPAFAAELKARFIENDIEWVD